MEKSNTYVILCRKLRQELTMMSEKCAEAALVDILKKGLGGWVVAVRLVIR